MVAANVSSHCFLHRLTSTFRPPLLTFTVYEILSMYETSFAKITDKYFKANPWPTVRLPVRSALGNASLSRAWANRRSSATFSTSERVVIRLQSIFASQTANLSHTPLASRARQAEAIAPDVDYDHVFCLLYKEIYFRHIYAKLTPTLEQRCESWDNYCQLFSAILRTALAPSRNPPSIFASSRPPLLTIHSLARSPGVILQGNVNMQLPNLWLWEMVDEFCYQFQSFCTYRSKLGARSAEELELLKKCGEKVWSVLGVVNFLQALVDKSGIVAILEKARASPFAQPPPLSCGRDNSAAAAPSTEACSACIPLKFCPSSLILHPRCIPIPWNRCPYAHHSICWNRIFYPSRSRLRRSARASRTSRIRRGTTTTRATSFACWCAGGPEPARTRGRGFACLLSLSSDPGPISFDFVALRASL